MVCIYLNIVCMWHMYVYKSSKWYTYIYIQYILKWVCSKSFISLWYIYMIHMIRIYIYICIYICICIYIYTYIYMYIYICIHMYIYILYYVSINQILFPAWVLYPLLSSALPKFHLCRRPCHLAPRSPAVTWDAHRSPPARDVLRRWRWISMMRCLSIPF